MPSSPAATPLSSRPRLSFPRRLTSTSKIPRTNGKWGQEQVLWEGWCSVRSITTKLSTPSRRYVTLHPKEIHVSHEYRGETFKRYPFDAGSEVRQSADHGRSVVSFSSSCKFQFSPESDDAGTWFVAITGVVDTHRSGEAPPSQNGSGAPAG
eukprot:1881273-Prymnesium_polylepis.1